ncbi:MAG: gliding motility protein GldL [Tannerella sp.]|nr:gliding motility protein GldL [Tannerella sp.]
MGKYKRYKNRIEMYLSSERGKRVLNFCYSWGASIVIIGAMFKLLHLPYGNEILFVAMITESLVFFISAFDRPNSDYNWEEVFPVLKSKNPLDRPDFERREGDGVTVVGSFTGDGQAAPGGVSGGGVAYVGGDRVMPGGGGGGVTYVGGGQAAPGGAGAGAGGFAYAGGAPAPTPQENVATGLAVMGLNVSEEDRNNLANSIQKLSEAAEQISKMADLTDVTQSYIEQITNVSQNLERFNAVAVSLSDVSDSLVDSCKAITGTTSEDDPGQPATGYVRQMEQLNQHLSGLNQYYEVQLNGLRTQMDTIHHINAGLNRIRDMYDSSMIDSAAFRNENERMAQLLTQLNQVYSRMLQAMTVNMPYAGMGAPYPPQQPPYQGGGTAYPQQPPYANPIR